MGKEKKEKKKDREAGAVSEADVTMDTSAAPAEVITYLFIYLLIMQRCGSEIICFLSVSDF